MKLFELESYFNPEAVSVQILNDCQQFLHEVEWQSDHVLFRGTSNRPSGKYDRNLTKSRNPKNSSREMHNFFIRLYNDLGITANRSNSLFCTGDSTDAQSYGDLYVIIPLDPFEFSWMDFVKDLYLDDFGFIPEIVDNKVIIDFILDLEKTKKTLEVIKFIPAQYKDKYQYWPPATKRKFLNKYLPSFKKELILNYIDLYEQLANPAVWDLDHAIKYFKPHIHTTNLERGLASGNEILIKCNEYWALRHNDWEQVKNILITSY